MLVADEGARFFDNIQKKQKNHESDLYLESSIQWERRTNDKERIVPPDSTSISISCDNREWGLYIAFINCQLVNWLRNEIKIKLKLTGNLKNGMETRSGVRLFHHLCPPPPSVKWQKQMDYTEPTHVPAVVTLGQLCDP